MQIAFRPNDLGARAKRRSRFSKNTLPQVWGFYRVVSASRTQKSTPEGEVAMKAPLWKVEWLRYGDGPSEEVWSSMTFACEEKAQAFTKILMDDDSHECVIYGQYPENTKCLIVKSAPRTAAIFAMVTWPNDSKTIHWNLPNDIIALWIMLDRFGDPSEIKRMQVCQTDDLGGDLDLDDVKSYLEDFSFNLTDDSDE